MGLNRKRITNEPMTDDEIEKLLRTEFLLSEDGLNRVSQHVLAALEHQPEEELVLKDSIGRIMVYISIVFLTGSIGYFLYEGLKDGKTKSFSISLNLDLSSFLPYLIALFIFVGLRLIGLVISVNKEINWKNLV